MKTCPKCGQAKPLSDFAVRKDTGKPRTHCRECLSKANLARYHSRPETQEAHVRAAYKHSLKRYGLSVERYEQMLDEQGHVCAICGDPETTGRRLAVDHDHSTGQVRALLCQACNTALGKFRDSPALLLKAAEYLNSHSREKAPCSDTSSTVRPTVSTTPPPDAGLLF